MQSDGHGYCTCNDMDIAEEFRMPELSGQDDKRIVLEHTVGPLKGVHSICMRTSDAPSPLPELAMAEEMIDSPRMRLPGPVGLVAVKPRYVLYRQIVTPELQNGKTFNEAQQ